MCDWGGGIAGRTIVYAKRNVRAHVHTCVRACVCVSIGTRWRPAVHVLLNTAAVGICI
jgi:hypothetical protein